MGEQYRRVILTPPGLAADAHKQLARSLNAAVEFQKRIAGNSPHILRLFGTLTPGDHGFHIEHEPATPIDIPSVFDAAGQLLKPDDWLTAAYAILESLRVSHAGQDGRPHGGLVPGALLRSPDGIWKVSDFRIAPALCDTIGIHEYLNLAVGPRDSTSKDEIITGAWEVLSDAEYERDDRICAFIDPEKYAGVLEHGERMLATFEFGSDVVAAGILLRLLAQHVHPFLGDDPEAHRVVDMSRMMASALAAPLRRQDLLDSADPTLKQFLPLLDKMLERLPKDRPRAADVADALRPGIIGKIDYSAIAARQDEEEAGRWLALLETKLCEKAWTDLDKLLTEAPALKNWPPKISARVEQIRKKVSDFSAAEKQQAQVAADGRAAKGWFDPLDAAVKSKNWEKAREIMRQKPSIRFWPEEIEKKIAPIEQSLAAEMKRLDDFDAARRWLAELVQSMDLGDWFSAEKKLAGKPQLQHWPAEVQEQAAIREKEVRQRLEAIRSQHQQARRWFEEAKQAARIKAYARALEILINRPTLQFWPEQLQEDADRLIEECTDRVGDDVFVKLQQHLSAVDRAVRAYIKPILETEFAGLLDAASLRISVDGDQVTTEETMNRGKAFMVWALPQRPKAEPSPEHRDPIEYDLDQTPPIQDEKQEVRRNLVDTIRSELQRLQSSGPGEIFATLKSGLFPDASLKLESKQLARQIKASLRLIRDDKTPFELELKWDARTLTWQPADAAALQRHIAQTAVRAARGFLTIQCCERAPLLKIYQSRLQLDIDMPSLNSAATSAPVSLTGTLALMHPVDGRRVALQTLKGEFTSVHKIELFGSWKEAETSFEAFLVEEQNNARQAAVDALSAAVADDAAKTKVSVTPKRIKSPTDEIVLEIKSKGSDRRTLAARWNPDKFVYDMEKFDAAATTPPKSVDQPAPGKATVKSAPPAKSISAEAAPAGSAPGKSPGGRRGMIVGAALALIALVTTVAFMIPRGGGSADGNSNVNPAENANANPIENNNANDNTPPARPAPPTEFTVNPLDVLAVADADFARDTGLILDMLDSAPRVPQSVKLSSAWQESSPGGVRATARVDLLDLPLEVVCELEFDPATNAWMNPKWSLSSNEKLNDVAASLQRRCLRRIGSLADENKAQEARDLYGAAAPLIAAFAEKGRCEPLPGMDEAIASRLKRDPPIPAPSYSIQDVLTPDCPGLAGIILATIPAEKANAGLQVAPPFDAKGWDLSKADQASQKSTLTIAGSPIDVLCTFSYSADRDAYESAPRWQIVSEPTALSELAERLIREVDAQAKTLSDDGKLAAARTALSSLTSGINEMRKDERFATLATPKTALPPEWNSDALPGYTPGTDLDPDTQYPLQVTADLDGRVMLLVALSPKDPTWNAIAQDALAHAWRIFYVDAREWNDDHPEKLSGKYYAYQDAQLRAELAGNQIPSRTDWMLAALKVRSQPTALNFFDGLFEWCSDPVEKGSSEDSPGQWVTGGCEINKTFNFPRRPSKSDADAAWITWLSSKLVTQVRSQNDELVGLRTIRPVFPSKP